MNTNTAKTIATIASLKVGDVMMVVGENVEYVTLGERNTGDAWNEAEFWFEGYDRGVFKMWASELAYEIEHENWILCICTSCGQMSHPGEC